MLSDAAQRQFGGNKGVRRSRRVAVLAGILHQPAHRITDQTQHIHKHGSRRVKALLRRAVQQFHRCRGRHGRRHAHLGLTAAHRARHGSVAHRQIAHRARIEQSTDHCFIRETALLL